jgi:endonuclease YncB( thermonuclease family)
MQLLPSIALVALLALAAVAGAAKLPPGGQPGRIAYVVDGDTVELANGAASTAWA